MAERLANPSDIARFTVDGVVIERVNLDLHTDYPNAIDLGQEEIEMFFVDADDASVMLDEIFAARSMLGRPHEAVEIDDNLDIGSSVSATGGLARFLTIDLTRSIEMPCYVMAVSFDMNTDRSSVELAGSRPGSAPVVPVTMDSTVTTMDSTVHSFDETTTL